MTTPDRYTNREMLTDIRNSIDRYLAQQPCSGPEPPPEPCPGSSELIVFDKPGIYRDCNLKGQIEVTSPGVEFERLRLEGTNPHYTLFMPHHGTKLTDCELVGSPNGQHRGVNLNWHGLRLINTRVKNIWSTLVSDAQAAAGWNGTKDLIMDGGEYWGATENVIFGGAPCPLEENIPQDIQLLNFTMDKELIWRNKQHGTVKNIFELKNAKRLKMKNVTMRHSWSDGQGQGGEAVVLTLRQERVEDQPAHNVIEDIELSNIEIENVGSGFNILGRDDARITEHCMKNVLLKDINVRGFDRHAWGGNGRQFMFGLGTENFVIDNVQFKGGPKEAYYTIISFYGYEQGGGYPYQNLGFVLKNSTVNEGTYAVHGAGAPTSDVIDVLNLYAPGYVWENVVVEDQSGYYVYP